ncbi:MAG: hypothetical protein KGD63_11430 [Candidatus Lokiarchaeota archaeon]|nr:hypothetical protein [Candidatus Lokiarchaeota archaeon]
MPESNDILNDINRVFIPCRTILEMEILTSLFLESKNYSLLKDVPTSHPTSQELIKLFNVTDIEPLERILKHFIDVIIEKLKPIVMYQRNFHDRFRMGNIVANSKTRLCLLLALHRLKLKFLVIKDFLDKFERDRFSLIKFQTTDIINLDFTEVFYDYYYEKNKMNLKLMLSSKRASERVSKLLDTSKSITNDDIYNAITFKNLSDNNTRIKFIMRELKASLFICKMMFAKIDVYYPFSLGKELDVNYEEIMISQDFIPVLVPAINKCMHKKNFDQLNQCLKAFNFMLDKALDGINYAIEIASGGQINLAQNEMIFTTGNIFSI